MKSSAKVKMMNRYADGGETVEYIESSSGPSRSMSSSESESESEAKAPMEQESEKPEYKSFKEAFAAERKAGNKTFEYMGKKYTTDMAARKEAAKPAAPAPKPALRAETNDDRAKRYVAKRAAARAEAAANPARGRSGVMLADGGVVKRATVKSHGKAC